MARPRAHLEHAPIAEAVIDFRVLRQEQVTPQMFENLGPLIGNQYSVKSEIQSISATFGFDNGRFLDPARVQASLGWRYQAETQIAQFRVDGFTFSKVEPYTTWEEVFGEAFRLWEVYVERAEPKQVSRIAVRYINRMRIVGASNLLEYLEGPPNLPAPIPQVIREFLSRIAVDDPARNASAVIVQALEPRVEPSTISLLLDIDAFKTVNSTPNDPELANTFRQLRALKNDIFFASITERTVETYA
jgi:uncharacterized protein (TIGR04255 family)